MILNILLVQIMLALVIWLYRIRKFINKKLVLLLMVQRIKIKKKKKNMVISLILILDTNRIMNQYTSEFKKYLVENDDN